ncbi:MAG: hypothetical protein Q8N36_03605, partial [bacterium]|nr:hypothetical protein [bacterium]
MEPRELSSRPCTDMCMGGRFVFGAWALGAGGCRLSPACRRRASLLCEGRPSALVGNKQLSPLSALRSSYYNEQRAISF